MSTVSLVSIGAVLTLFASTATPLASADGTEPTAEDTSPALVLPLTTDAGVPTEIATSALEGTTVGGGGSTVRAITGTRLSLLGASGSALDPSTDAAILTEPLEVVPFFVTGLTWDGGAELAEGTEVYIRVREGEGWSEWYLTEAEASARDDGVGRAGTEPFVTGGADGVQIRVTGSSEDLPENLALTMLPADPDGQEVLAESDVTPVAATATTINEDSLGDQSGEVALPGAGSPEPQGEGAESGDTGVTTQSGGITAPGTGSGTGRSTASSALQSVFPTSTTANDLPVAVSSRADWGADESIRSWDPEYASASFVVVHHTAGTNSYTMDQSASVVRGIYHYHAVTLGWGDIGYNFLVDKWGRAFEGRAGSLASPSGKMVVGAHDLGFNTGTMGISMIGDYSSVTPSDATLDTVGKLAGWQLSRAGVPATGSGSFTPKISNGTLVAGRTVTVNRVSGHRDTYATSCPGNAGYAQLGRIRSIAAAVAAPITTSTNPIGALESVTVDNAKGTITVTGWAFDADTTSPINAHIYIDSSGHSTQANKTRTDIQSKVAAVNRSTVGYQATYTTTPGTHKVCVAAINAGGGTNQWVGCQTVTLTTSTSGFAAGDIISDAVMFDPGTMTAAQVQSFLTAQNGNCTKGADGTACLKDYRTSSKSMKYPYCTTYAAATNETAAQVISKASAACGINPRVLITMLQKEQGLVTATGSALTATRYDKAMGLRCPDSSSCDAAHAGFAPQVYGAASRLVQYGEEPQTFNYRAGQTTKIAYSPTASCGSGSVTIANRATAALYNYTPYQPNAAALGNLYGTGDSCSTYGNRNFWRMFRDWFGSTH